MAGRTIQYSALAAAIVASAAAGYYFWSRPSAPRLTDRDRILVADFVNSTGDAGFDDALKPAVVVQMQQTPFLTLLPDPRVQRTLRMMQRRPDEPVTGDVARELCQRAGGKATVEGAITKDGSAFDVELVVRDCETGMHLARETAQASDKAAVIERLGTALRDLRRSLGEPAATLETYDARITESTSSSLEALQAYGQGLRARATRGDEASFAFFKQAVDRDPEFALGYAKLGVVTGNIGRADEAREYTARAYGLRRELTEYERLYVIWNHASRVLLDQKAVRESLEVLTTAYPRDFAARNNFGVYYNNNGQVEEALQQYRAASEIAPDEPGPIANSAYVLFLLGRYDEASDAVDRVLAMRPDSNLAVTRWITARVMDLPRAAEFEQVARNLAGADQMALGEASLAAWSGRLQAFEKMQDDFIARAEATGNVDAAKGVGTGKLITLAAYRRGRDLDALKSAAAREQDPPNLAQLVSALAMLGEIDAVRPTVKRFSAGGSDSPLGPPLVVARAYVQAQDGQTADAIASLQAMLTTNPRARDLEFFIADLRERSGDADRALIGYRTVIGSLTYLGPSPLIPMARLKAAKILAAKGDRTGALEQLDALLKQWKDADEEFPALTEVRKLRAGMGQ
jgi:tetratricopeptide (TPR) repeat protein